MADYSNSIIAAAGSLFGATITTELLYSISNLTELWIALLLIVAIYLEVVQKYLVAETKLRTKREIIVLQFLGLLRVMIIIVLMRLFIDRFFYIFSVTFMQWDDYLNQFSFLIYYLCVVLYQFQEDFSIKLPSPKSKRVRPSNAI